MIEIQEREFYCVFIERALALLQMHWFSTQWSNFHIVQSANKYHAPFAQHPVLSSQRPVLLIIGYLINSTTAYFDIFQNCDGSFI